MSTWLRTLTIVAALGCGTMAGVFFAFSTLVTDGLRKLPAPQGISAMQSINLAAPRPAFMLLLLGTGAVCAAQVVAAIVTRDQRPAAFLLAGAVLYLLTAIVLTAGYHIPLNNKLADADPNSAAAAQQWADYLRNWVRWNHLRCAGSLAAAAAFTVALFR